MGSWGALYGAATLRFKALTWEPDTLFTFEPKYPEVLRRIGLNNRDSSPVLGYYPTT